MKWIRENINYIASKLHVTDAEAEHRKAIERIQKLHPLGNQCVYALSYFDEKLIYLTDSVKGLLGYDSDDIHELAFFYDLIHPDDFDAVRELTLQGDPGRQFEV